MLGTERHPGPVDEGEPVGQGGQPLPGMGAKEEPLSGGVLADVQAVAARPFVVLT
ncbi:hypothetical protein [Streptomyces sp. Tu 3180]|uniref:hypothetical protein n=1 Tax=Streptomyces sp. Tu 3180 TaxID=2682611 RepID=UPI001FB6115F|nr:hypothetical protein [Streptomyces sp. Tu 3180]